jgi:peroxiredoxin
MTSGPFSGAHSQSPFAAAETAFRAHPGTFVVDRDGKILYAYADEDHTQRPERREFCGN